MPPDASKRHASRQDRRHEGAHPLGVPLNASMPPTRRAKPGRLALTGTLVRFVGERDHVRRDGAVTGLWVWAITCAECGAWFEQGQSKNTDRCADAPTLDLGRIARRCEECRT